MQTRTSLCFIPEHTDATLWATWIGNTPAALFIMDSQMRGFHPPILGLYQALGVVMRHLKVVAPRVAPALTAGECEALGARLAAHMVGLPECARA